MVSRRTRDREGWDRATRRAILDEYAVVAAALDELAHVEIGTDRDFHHRLLVHQDLYTDHSMDLRRRYEEGVPVVPLSRCPLTDTILHHSIDHHGLDGLWWVYDGAVRPLEDLPATFVGLTGALRLGGPLEYTPFLVKPGPPAPFLVPRVLEAGAVAVISQGGVGDHTGWAIAYFAESHPNTTLFNEWGRNQYRMCSAGIAVAWDEAEDTEAMDFDLAPWIERDKVLWIAPGDRNLRLRRGTDGCPYLGLPGPFEPQRFQYAAAWTRR